MGTVKRLAEEVKRGLGEAHPRLRKTVIKKRALAVGAMLEGQTPNTVELANLLPLETERQDMREQWLRRLLKNPLLRSKVLMEPVARQELEKAACNGQRVLLSLDQTDLGNRMAVLMMCLRVGDRSLPLAWIAQAGAANSGFEGQRIVLERVLAWLPAGAEVVLSADRFYPSGELFEWLHVHGWGYRLRLKGAMYWCVRVGRDDAGHRPTPLEKKLMPRPTRTTGASENSTAARCPGSNGGCVA